jgi:hypothetical protein
VGYLAARSNQTLAANNVRNNCSHLPTGIKIGP